MVDCHFSNIQKIEKSNTGSKRREGESWGKKKMLVF
jgi:hypothetical protein